MVDSDCTVHARLAYRVDSDPAVKAGTDRVVTPWMCAMFTNKYTDFLIDCCADSPNDIMCLNHRFSFLHDAFEKQFNVSYWHGWCCTDQLVTCYCWRSKFYEKIGHITRRT